MANDDVNIKVMTPYIEPTPLSTFGLSLSGVEKADMMSGQYRHPVDVTETLA